MSPLPVQRHDVAIRSSVDCRGHAVVAPDGRTLGDSVATTTPPNVIAAVLPEIETVVAALSADLADSQDELRVRVRLAFLNTHVAADADDLEAAIKVLRARAAGDEAQDPFGERIEADSYDALVEVADRAVAHGDLDLMTVLALQYQSGAIAAMQGRRLAPVPWRQCGHPPLDVGARGGRAGPTRRRAGAVHRAWSMADAVDPAVVAGRHRGVSSQRARIPCA